MAYRRGFSLLELVVVVVVVTILAAVAVARVGGMAERSKQASVRQTFSAFQTALSLYHADYGEFPPDTNAGTRIVPLDGYLKLPGLGSRPAPFGGYWDWNNNDVAYWAGTPANVAIHWRTGTVPNADLLAYDLWADDGSLTTGVYLQFKTHRFYGIEITP